MRYGAFADDGIGSSVADYVLDQIGGILISIDILSEPMLTNMQRIVYLKSTTRLTG